MTQIEKKGKPYVQPSVVLVRTNTENHFWQEVFREIMNQQVMTRLMQSNIAGTYKRLTIMIGEMI